MKQIPTPDSSHSLPPLGETDGHAADQQDWLLDMLRRQVRLDAPADQDFTFAVMQMLPSEAERVAGTVAVHRQLAVRGHSALPAWLAAALPWLGLYGLIVTAATLLWLALTLAVMPGAILPAAPSLLAGAGALEAWEELVDSLGAALGHWLAPAMILGWLVWCLLQQERLME